MNDELLIALVRDHPALYDIENNKYSDNHFKDKIWAAISKELRMTVTACKNRWNCLRDQWRKDKRKKQKRSGQGTLRKWRYEDDMNFLLPFLRERNSQPSVDDVFEETEDTNEEDMNTAVEDTVDDVKPAVTSPRRTSLSLMKRKKMHFTTAMRSRQKTPERSLSSAALVKFFEKQEREAEQSKPAEKDNVDKFFDSIAAKVRLFSPYYRNLAESKIFALVQEMELQQIMQNQPPSTNSQHFLAELCTNNQTTQNSSTPSPSTTNTVASNFEIFPQDNES